MCSFCVPLFWSQSHTGLRTLRMVGGLIISSDVGHSLAVSTGGSSWLTLVLPKRRPEGALVLQDPDGDLVLDRRSSTSETLRLAYETSSTLQDVGLQV